MYTIFHCGEESILSRNFHPLEEHLLSLVIPWRGIPRGKREEKEEREEGNKGRAEGGQSETRSIEAVFGRENRSKDGGNCGKFRPFIPRQWGRSRVLRKFSMLRVSIMLSPFSFLPLLPFLHSFLFSLLIRGWCTVHQRETFRVARGALLSSPPPSREKPPPPLFSRIVLEISSSRREPRVYYFIIAIDLSRFSVASYRWMGREDACRCNL